jgi:DeoR/GlpR family transcriptional regulator of sugar metabolism
MTGGERRQVILHRLRAATRVTVAELVDATAASEMTIRRDLDVLAAQGRLRRVHGGAVLLRQTEPASFDTRLALAAEAKQAIGATTASLIADGETVVLDRGTTALAVARHLRDRPVTVMPLSLHAAFALMDGTRARVLLPGGQPSLPELALAGPLAVASLRSLRFDVAVLGASAFSAAIGITTPDLADAEAKQQALAVAGRALLAVDGSKWGRTALVRVCPPDELDVVVTDSSAPQAERDILATTGVRVLLAS